MDRGQRLIRRLNPNEETLNRIVPFIVWRILLKIREEMCRCLSRWDLVYIFLVTWNFLFNLETHGIFIIRDCGNILIFFTKDLLQVINCDFCTETLGLSISFFKGHLKKERPRKVVRENFLERNFSNKSNHFLSRCTTLAI